jgi:hypothetical protein
VISSGSTTAPKKKSPLVDDSSDSVFNERQKRLKALRAKQEKARKANGEGNNHFLLFINNHFFL